MMKHVYGFLGRWKVQALLVCLFLVKCSSSPSDSPEEYLLATQKEEPAKTSISIPEKIDLTRLTFEGLDQQNDLDAVLFEMHRRKKSEEWGGEAVPLRVGQYFVWKHRNDMKSTDPNSSKTPSEMKERIQSAYTNLTGGDFTEVYALPTENTTKEVSDTIRNIRNSDNQDAKRTLGIILCIVVLVGWKIASNWQEIANGCGGCLITIIVIIGLMIFAGAMSFDDVQQFLSDVLP